MSCTVCKLTNYPSGFLCFWSADDEKDLDVPQLGLFDAALI